LQKLVSLIIRTKNEERWITSCLKAVFKQNYNNIEVVIVDNRSTDKTLIKANEFPVKVVQIKDFFPGKAINDGIRASSGEYIVCLSGHCVPVNSDWLGNLVNDLENPAIAGVYGKQEPLSFTSDIDKRDLLTVFGQDKKIQVKDSFFHNANSAFRRKIWESFPFDEALTNIEDRVWGQQVISKGFNIIYEPAASVFHWHGIHQDLNPLRAKNIVRILESLDGFNTNSNEHQKPEDLKILAVIPVKGEPLYLNEKPLIERTIESAKKSSFINDIVVATDNQKVSSISKKMGVESPFIRPAELSEGYIDIFEVIGYTLDQLEKDKRYYDIVILLEEVYPFRQPDVIDKMITELVNGGYDTVVAGENETRGIWMKSKENVQLLGGVESLSMPSALKESNNIIGLLGFCTVTHAASVHNNIIFSGKVGIVEIDSPLSLVSARNSKELELAKIIDNHER
jgi:rhamnosyltransferase